MFHKVFKHKAFPPLGPRIRCFDAIFYSNNYKHLMLKKTDTLKGV
jgi:hypothetical protein